MNEVDILLIVGIFLIGCLIRREMRRGAFLEQQSKDDKKETGRLPWFILKKKQSLHSGVGASRKLTRGQYSIGADTVADHYCKDIRGSPFAVSHPPPEMAERPRTWKCRWFLPTTFKHTACSCDGAVPSFRGLLTHRLLQQAVATGAVTYGELAHTWIGKY